MICSENFYKEVVYLVYFYIPNKADNRTIYFINNMITIFVFSFLFLKNPEHMR